MSQNSQTPNDSEASAEWIPSIQVRGAQVVRENGFIKIHVPEGELLRIASDEARFSIAWNDNARDEFLDTVAANLLQRVRETEDGYQVVPKQQALFHFVRDVCSRTNEWLAQQVDLSLCTDEEGFLPPEAPKEC